MLPAEILLRKPQILSLTRKNVGCFRMTAFWNAIVQSY